MNPFFVCIGSLTCFIKRLWSIFCGYCGGCSFGVLRVWGVGVWYLSRVVFNMGVVLGVWCGSSLGLWGGGVWFELYGGGGSVVCQGCWGLKGEVWLLIVCFLCVGWCL